MTRNMTVKEHTERDFLKLKEDLELVLRRILRPQQEKLVEGAPPIESWIDSERKELHVRMPVPGMKAEVLNLILQRKYVLLEGEPTKADDESIKSYLERLFSGDSFVRTIELPDGVDGTKITAELKDGFLELSAPIDASSSLKSDSN